MAARTRRIACTIVIALAASAAALAAPTAASAALTISEPSSGSRTGPTPTFLGTTDDALDAVQVSVYGGSEATGKPALTLTAQPEMGEWSVETPKDEALAAGSYTLVAEQEGLLAIGPTERAGPVHFTVDSEAPTVTIVQPPQRSNDRAPSFSGTASEDGNVIVHVLEGGTEVASAQASATAGSWSTDPLSPALPPGKHDYEAYASEQSTLGNGPGSSGDVPFEVDTEPPSVTIQGPPSPSRDTTPSFSGTASEETEVTVHVREGGTEVAQVETLASGGRWEATLANALPSGKHSFTAVATESSGIHNAEGESSEVSFVVDTEAPHLTLRAPSSPSSDRTPSFAGTADEPGDVEVQISLEGSVVSSADAETQSGSWTSLEASPALPPGKHVFSAVAFETSALGNAEGHSEAVSFEVDTEKPSVTMTAPLRSADTTPSFSGSASENTEVEVHVLLGTSEVATATTTASNGSWSTPPLRTPLAGGDHTYTAYATEKSGLNNEPGTSTRVSFEVDTEAPTVTIEAPPSPSKQTSPAFTGTASEPGEVEVHVFEGTSEVARATASASGGTWSTSSLSKALPAGRHTFTASAAEQSAIGNGAGHSGTVSFEVDTEKPTVTIVGPQARSNDTTPRFTGTAGEETEVVVHVLEGTTEVASVATTTSGGNWAATLGSALPGGKHSYTAYATARSTLDNGEGESSRVSFEVDTAPPTVTLDAPAARSDDTTPSFSGAASEETEVTVRVREGSTEVASASTRAAGGHWSVALSKALPPGRHSYSAFATEKSALSNPEGTSAEVAFEVDTTPPTVTLTGPPSRSNDTTPSFSGTASEDTEVTVHISEGGVEVASARTTAAAGAWSVTLSTPLPAGKRSFTATATEKSGIDNGEGRSSSVGFEVDTEPPVVTLANLASPSDDVNPSFSGSASEDTSVTVDVSLEGKLVASGSATAADGSWTVNGISPRLPSGKHTFTATASESSGLGNKPGSSDTISFEVDTEPPIVTIAAPPSPSKNRTPTFTGSASEDTEVTVHVLAAGSEVEKAATIASGGKWSVALPAPLASGKHRYSAYATERSGIGNSDGYSNGDVEFEVDTQPPNVTVDSPALVSAETTPEFSGTASEGGTVTVAVYEGAATSGKAVWSESVRVSAGGGAWKTKAVTPALASGTFTIVATEPSGLGNEPGQAAASFEVNTAAPTVGLNAIESPTSDLAPRFSGSVANKPGSTVTVLVYEGRSTSGKIVETVTTPVEGTKWQTRPLPTPLEEGHQYYTVVATAASSVPGDPVGKSTPLTFLVSTEPPILTLAQPVTPSRDSAPTFQGSTDEASAVEVFVYRGAKPEGALALPVLTATPSGESWQASSPSALADGQYTAIARQQSAIGNGQSSTGPVTFTIDTHPPTVTIASVPARSGNRMPSFSGTATDVAEPVTVTIYSGAYTSVPPSGAPVVATEAVPVEEGAWATPRVARLELGAYTAIATQKSSIGNGSGESQAVDFEVAAIPPSAQTEAAREVGTTSAGIFASVDPLGAPVSSCFFEYGPTTAYGKKVECGFVSESIVAFPAAGEGGIPVFARIYGLKSSTLYHVRIVAEGEGGIAQGADSTFTTLEAIGFPEERPATSTATTTKPASGGVASFFASQLDPTGRGARIPALLEHDGYTLKLKVPRAGRATIDWYYLPRGAKLASAKRKKPVPVLVASGTHSFATAGSATLKLVLTRAGRALLRHAKRLKVTVSCRFAPRGAAATSVAAVYTLSS